MNFASRHIHFGFISGGSGGGGGGSVTQGTTPWVVSFNGGSQPVTQSGVWNVTVNTALPTGANVIGGVTQSGAWNVAINAALPTGANTIGAVTQASAPWRVNANSGDFVDGAINTLGTQADAAWVSGNGTAIAVLKGIFGKLAGTLTTTISGTVNVLLQAGTNVAGAVGLAALTGNGASVSRLGSSAATTNATNVKASAGTILAIIGVLNTNAAVRYVHLYDKASAPTPGTDTPIITLAIPPSNGGRETSIPIGIKCVNGIGYAMTTDAAAGNNAVASGDLVGFNLSYV